MHRFIFDTLIASYFLFILPAICWSAEELDIQAGDEVVINVPETEMQLSGKMIGKLKLGTSFKVVKVAPNSLAGYAIIDGKKQPGWIRRADVTKRDLTGELDSSTVKSMKDKTNDETDASKSKPPGEPYEDSPNTPLKYMSIARIRALPAENNLDSVVTETSAQADPNREVIPLYIISADGKKSDNCVLRPDGKVVISTSQDGDICLSEYPTDRPLVSFKAHDGRVRLSYSHSGELLVTGGVDDGKVKLWKMDNQELLSSWDQDSGIRSLEFSSDDQWIVCGSLDEENEKGEVVIYDVAKRARKLALDGETYGAFDVAFSPDGKRIAAIRLPKERESRKEPICWTEIWDWQAEKKLLSLPNLFSIAECLDFSPNGKDLAIGETEGESMMNITNRVRIVDAETGVTKGLLIGHRHRMRDITYAPDGKSLASVSMDRSLRFWDMESYQLIGLASLQAGYEGSQLSYAADGRTISYSNSAATQVIGRDRLTFVDKYAFDSLFHGNSRNSIHALTFTPDGNQLLIARMHAVYRFHLQTNEELEIIPRSADPNRPVIYGLDQKGELAINAQRSVEVFSLPDGELVNSFRSSLPNLKIPVISPDGRLLAISSGQDLIEVWDIKSGKLLGKATFKSGEPSCMLFTSGGKYLVATDYNLQDSVIGIWDLSDRNDPNGAPLEHVRDIRVGRQIHELKLMPDGERIFASGESSVILKPSTVETTPVPLNIWCSASSPNGRLLATSGDAKEKNAIHIYESSSLKKLASLTGRHPGPVIDLAFSPDGKVLASADEAGIMALWDTDTWKEIVIDAKALHVKEYEDSKK